MKVLLTGMPGWLSGRFLEVLIRGFNNEGPVNDWKIKCLVLNGGDTSSIDALSKIKRVEKITGDVTKIETLKAIAKDVDIVFHMAGVIHPKRVKQLFEVNTSGTENMLKVSLEAGVKRFVYISSNSTAGTNKFRHKLMTEKDVPNPYMNYGLSKYYAECIVKKFQETGKIETVILRPCWFYGPNQPSRQTKFFKMIKKGNPIIFGNGCNLRSMSYIDSTSQAMLLAAESEKANGQTYWIADAKPYSTYQIYKTIAELLEVKKFKPVYLPNFSSEIFLLADKMLQSAGRYITEIHVAGEMNKDIACSIEKAREELGYNPTVELKEGMNRSIEWCRKSGILI
ncbi:MAG: NAD(P)-dependent oxidoreductase [Candidatus Omnitrophica bacterium]|nr:NAD(P)-dependent oxidoreductase [Candidatus Omnitrophota bacterium]